jgi:predicted amidohydrolase
MKEIVAVAQYDVPESVQDSIKKLGEVAKSAVSQNAKLLVAPETAIGMLGDVKSASTDYLPELQRIAKENGITIATSFYTKNVEKFFNQGYIVSGSGEVLLKHRKIYLAPLEVENDGISAGNELSVAGSELGKLGMVICKDGFNKYSHFLYQRLADLNTEVIAVPTWSIGWKKALGVDNSEYVKAMYVYGAFLSRAYVLVAGNLNKSTESFGKSLIVSPIRGVLQEGSRDKEGLLIQEINLEEVKKVREFDSWWQPKEKII